MTQAAPPAEQRRDERAMDPARRQALEEIGRLLKDLHGPALKELERA